MFGRKRVASQAQICRRLALCCLRNGGGKVPLISTPVMPVTATAAPSASAAHIDSSGFITHTGDDGPIGSLDAEAPVSKFNP